MVHVITSGELYLYLVSAFLFGSLLSCHLVTCYYKEREYEYKKELAHVSFSTMYERRC